MIKDEYEILAYTDLMVANGYLDALRDEMMRQKSLFTASGDILEDVYINLVLFTIKYKNRMDDIRAIASKIEEARSKHRSVVQERNQLAGEVVDLHKQLEKTRLENIDLDAELRKLKSNVKSILL